MCYTCRVVCCVPACVIVKRMCLMINRQPFMICLQMKCCSNINFSSKFEKNLSVEFGDVFEAIVGYC